jgi:hypothetical protein
VRVSRRELEARNGRQANRIEALIADRDSFEKDADACGYALAQVAGELSTLKDEIALHIVACKHPSSALSDAHSAAIALQEALAAHGVDLRLELARLEGTDL